MNAHGLRGLLGGALLVQRLELRPEFERTRPSVHAGEIADGGLSDPAFLGDLNLGHPSARQFGDQLLPVHRKPFKHRIADIMNSGLPIVNIGRLIGMEKSKEKRGKSSFGLRMTAARKAAKPKLTQDDVCEAIQISQGTLSGLENDAQGSSYTVEFAKLYGVDPHWLATGEGAMRPASGTPPAKPPKNFEDRRVVSPSQWALLQAVEDLMPEVDRAELLRRWHRTRERMLAELKETGVRGMSLPMEFDDAPIEQPKDKGAAKK